MRPFEAAIPSYLVVVCLLNLFLQALKLTRRKPYTYPLVRTANPSVDSGELSIHGKQTPEIFSTAVFTFNPPSSPNVALSYSSYEN